MLKYASKIRFIIFTLLSIISFIFVVAGVVLTIVHNDFAYECGAILIMLIISSIWTLLLEKTD